jgi:hypothetical protein
VGVVLYELCTGTHPFPNQNPEQLARAVLDTQPEHPKRLDPSLPDDLADIVMKCLAKEPQKRFSSARDLRDALGTFLETLTLSNKAQRLDELIASVWSEEIQEDAARSRRASAPAGHAPTPAPPTPLATPVVEPLPSSLESKVWAPALRVERAESLAPPPVLVSGESPFTTTDRMTLDRVFASAPKSPPTPPAMARQTTSIPRPNKKRSRAAERQDSPPVLPGPVLTGPTWQIPRSVALAALASTVLATAAISGAAFWVLGVGRGRDNGPAPLLDIRTQDTCAVTVDGNPWQHPATRYVVAGIHHISLSCPGKETVVHDVAVSAGQHLLVTMPALSAPPALGADVGNGTHPKPR